MQSEVVRLGVNMRSELIFGILLVVSIALLAPASAETEVLMVNVDPSNVDNRVDEEVNFDADCTVCNEEQLEYYYWNSSIDGILTEGSDYLNLNFAMGSNLFATGDHNICLLYTSPSPRDATLSRMPSSA